MELELFQSLNTKKLSSSELSDNSSLEDPTCKAACYLTDWEIKCKTPFPGGICQKTITGKSFKFETAWGGR